MRITTALFLTTILFSCANIKELAQENSPKNVVFSELSVSDNSGFLEKKQQIITTSNAYDETWSELFSNYMKKPPIPTINFETSMVILVAMGEKSNGGYSTNVKSIIETENQLIITVEEKIPAKNCMTTSVIVHPAQLIEIPVTSKEITFKIVEQIYNCEE